MRKYILALAALLCLAGTAPAAMFGDFLVADALRPARSASAGHNNRTAVLIPLSSGGDVVLYFPTHGQQASSSGVLASIAMNLDPNHEIIAYNVGGRPWFGNRIPMQDGIVFYDGYTHRNGVLYNLAFSLNTMSTPNEEVKRALSRVWLTPNLPNQPSSVLVQAMDAMEMGQFDNVDALLNQAAATDTNAWLRHYLRGRLEEMEQNLQAAAAAYQQALGLYRDDVELAARVQGVEAFLGSTDQAIARLADMGEQAPDEAIIWETLGRIYLAADELDAAKDYFDEAAAINPSSETALYNLAFIHAQQAEYENAFRRAREFAFYRPWVPRGVVPDVSGAPGMTQGRMMEILSEPLPLGYIEDYANFTPVYPTEQEIQQEVAVIIVEQPPTVVYETYAPVIMYSWSWSPHYYRRPGHWLIDRPNRPWWNRPPPNRPRPPPARPPHRPNRPRPPGSGGNRPGRPDPGRPERPQPPSGGNRPPSGGAGNRPPPGGEGTRPPSGGGNRPPPGEGGNRPRPPERPNIDVQPELPNVDVQPIRPQPGNRPERPEPGNRPERPGQGSRPQPSERPSIDVQPERPRPSERPNIGTQPERPSRPETRPSPPARPSRPEGATRPSRPEPSAPPAQRPETRPSPRPSPPAATRPATPSRPSPRPAPAQPPRREQQSSRPAPQARPSRPVAQTQQARPMRETRSEPRRQQAVQQPRSAPQRQQRAAPQVRQASPRTPPPAAQDPAAQEQRPRGRR